MVFYYGAFAQIVPGCLRQQETTSMSDALRGLTESSQAAGANPQDDEFGGLSTVAQAIRNNYKDIAVVATDRLALSCALPEPVLGTVALFDVLRNLFEKREAECLAKLAALHQQHPALGAPPVSLPKGVLCSNVVVYLQADVANASAFDFPPLYQMAVVVSNYEAIWRSLGPQYQALFGG